MFQRYSVAVLLFIPCPHQAEPVCAQPIIVNPFQNPGRRFIIVDFQIVVHLQSFELILI